MRKHCPVCKRTYVNVSEHKQMETHHHIFPKRMYPGCSLKVDVCKECHDEFNFLFPQYQRKWTKNECVEFWIIFCDLHNVSALGEYPQLINAFCT